MYSQGVPEVASVEVKHVVKNEDGRVRWWFWLEGRESVFKLIDSAHFGDFWKIEMRPHFLVSSGSVVGAALSESHSMRGESSKGWGGGADAGVECDANAGVECDMDCVSVKMMCWNVAGWARGDGKDEARTVEGRDMRAFYKPDVVCLDVAEGG